MLDEMRRGLESIQRSRHIIYDELDSPVIGRMLAMCLSSLEDYVFVVRMMQHKEASNKIRMIDASPKSSSPGLAPLSIDMMD